MKIYWWLLSFLCLFLVGCVEKSEVFLDEIDNQLVLSWDELWKYSDISLDMWETFGVNDFSGNSDFYEEYDSSDIKYCEDFEWLVLIFG